MTLNPHLPPTTSRTAPSGLYVPSVEAKSAAENLAVAHDPNPQPMSDKYSAVIEDLNDKRENLVNQSYLIQDKINQIDTIVTSLQAFQAMV